MEAMKETYESLELVFTGGVADQEEISLEGLEEDYDQRENIQK